MRGFGCHLYQIQTPFLPFKLSPDGGKLLDEVGEEQVVVHTDETSRVEHSARVQLEVDQLLTADQGLSQ